MPKAIEIQRFGEAQTLVYRDHETRSTLADHEVRIDVHFSGINFADIIMRLGFYNDAPPKPFIPGYEISGVITEIGSQVQNHKVGDKVMAGCRFGGYVSEIIVQDWMAVPLRVDFSMEDGAAFLVNAITAYLALNEFGRVRSGDKILIDCATGGVGVIALQMAKDLGAHTVGLTSSPAKKEFIESYGAQAFTWEEFEKNPQIGFDYILNSTGGSAAKYHYKLLAMSGKMSCIGMQDGIKDGKRNVFAFLKNIIQMPWYPLVKLMMDSKMVSGLNALKFFDNDEWVQKHLVNIQKINAKPYIGKVFSAKEAYKAHECLEKRQARGKVLLSWKD